MDLVRVDAGVTLDTFHRRVLSPHFPPSELVSVEALRSGMDDGSVEVWAATDEAGRMVGGVVGEFSPSCRVMLLSYLAVVADRRGGGTGSFLYDQVIRQWAVRYRPCAIVAEVEHPQRHSGSEAYGDPSARLRFYSRHGARILRLPYFQPPLGPGHPRVYGMLLLLLHADPPLWGSAKGRTLAAQPLRTFLTEYLESGEGSVAHDDPAVARLWGALDERGGVPVLSMAELAAVPVSDFRRTLTTCPGGEVSS